MRKSAYIGVLIRFTLVALLLPCGLLTACSQQDAPERLPELVIDGRTMGTTYSVKLVRAPESIEPAELKADLDRDLVAINQAMSTYLEDSALSKFNREQPGQWHPVPAMLITVLGEAGRVFRLSEGAFDPSVAPLVNLWGFGPDLEVEFPAHDEVEQAVALVGFDHLELDEQDNALRKRQAMTIDLSAIAKGYAVDHVAELLASLGVENYLVEIGGELRAAGHNAEREPWRIAVEKPLPGQRAVHGVLRISGLGMATSGDYRNFFEKDGQRYSHTIDPRTGYPVAHSLVSVTVLAGTSMTADALATAFMVMGAQDGYKLAESEQIAAWFIEDREGELVDRLTPKMQSYRLH